MIFKNKSKNFAIDEWPKPALIKIDAGFFFLNRAHKKAKPRFSLAGYFLGLTSRIDFAILFLAQPRFRPRAAIFN